MKFYCNHILIYNKFIILYLMPIILIQVYSILIVGMLVLKLLELKLLYLVQSPSLRDILFIKLDIMHYDVLSFRIIY